MTIDFPQKLLHRYLTEADALLNILGEPIDLVKDVLWRGPVTDHLGSS